MPFLFSAKTKRLVDYQTGIVIRSVMRACEALPFIQNVTVDYMSKHGRCITPVMNRPAVAKHCMLECAVTT